MYSANSNCLGGSYILQTHMSWIQPSFTNVEFTNISLIISSGKKRDNSYAHLNNHLFSFPSHTSTNQSSYSQQSYNHQVFRTRCFTVLSNISSTDFMVVSETMYLFGLY